MATFNNYATLTYHGMSRISNLVTGEILASIKLTKTAVVENYAPGGDVTYLVSIRNSGVADLSGLQLTDDLGAYAFGAQTLKPLSYQAVSLRYYVNGELQASPTTQQDTDLVIENLVVPAGGNAMLVYTVSANEYAPLCSEGLIRNVVTLSGGGLAEAITAEAEVAPRCEAELSISKTVSPAAVTENGELTFTFVITNFGGVAAAAEDGVSVSDVFTPLLINPVVTLNGNPMTAAQYTYNTATGQFATNPGIITVPAAAASGREAPAS